MELQGGRAVFWLSSKLSLEEKGIKAYSVAEQKRSELLKAG